jgi:hypothetical protein
MKKRISIAKIDTDKFHWLPKFEYNGLNWKDKYGTPRILLTPMLFIKWFNGHWSIEFGSEDYWERKLWIDNYNNGDKIKAEQTWPWNNSETKKSSWDETDK